MRPTYSVTELLGDGIGSELSRVIHLTEAVAAAVARRLAPQPQARLETSAP